jgi:hypothetical protein
MVVLFFLLRIAGYVATAIAIVLAFGVLTALLPGLWRLLQPPGPESFDLGLVSLFAGFIGLFIGIWPAILGVEWLVRSNDRRKEKVKTNAPDPWPFDQPRNCATFTTRQVVEGLEPILLVSHDAEDHGWQFIGSSDGTMANALIVCLAEIVKRDSTVLEVADLLPGWQATRESVGGDWTRRESPPVPDDER